MYFKLFLLINLLEKLLKLDNILYFSYSNNLPNYTIMKINLLQIMSYYILFRKIEITSFIISDLDITTIILSETSLVLLIYIKV